MIGVDHIVPVAYNAHLGMLLEVTNAPLIGIPLKPIIRIQKGDIVTAVDVL